VPIEPLQRNADRMAASSFPREMAGNACACASAATAAALADSFPALSDTPHRTALAKVDFVAKPIGNRRRFEAPILCFPSKAKEGTMSPQGAPNDR
jgi:hypothetical protein